MKIYIDIICRVILASAIIGFVLSMTLWKKYKIFDNIGYGSFILLTFYGIAHAISTVIFGF